MPETPSTHGQAAGARQAEQTPARAATPASSVAHASLQIPRAPALCSCGVQGAPYRGRAESREAGSHARVWEQRRGGTDPTGSPLQVKVRTGWEQMGPALLVKERFCYLC